MEVIGAASSLAGLLSLAAQCLSGAKSLYSFYKALDNESSMAQSFPKDINSLIRTILEVEELLEKIKAHDCGFEDNVSLTSLRLQMEDCDVLLKAWIKTAESRTNNNGKGLRNRFRNFWNAINKDSVDTGRQEMQRRRLEISVALSTLGTAFDIQLLRSTKTIEMEVRETNVSTHMIWNASTDANKALQRLEAASASMCDEIGSIKSLMSSLSSVSVGAVKSSPATSPAKGPGASTEGIWRCDAWNSIEDLFRFKKFLFDGTKIVQCGFCGYQFMEDVKDHPLRDSDQQNIRMEHIKITHKLTTCHRNPSKFDDLESFHEHLKKVHNAIFGETWTAVLDDSCRVEQDRNCRGQGFAEIITEEQVAPAEPEPPDVSGSEIWQEDDALHTILNSSWDANLLGEFTSPRDRINRWLLHMLGSDHSHAKLHRRFFCEIQESEADLSTGMWNRLVLKHWFMDDAALGIDMTTALLDLDAVEARPINSSLYLAARTSAHDGAHPITEQPNLSNAPGDECAQKILTFIRDLENRLRLSSGVYEGPLPPDKKVASKPSDYFVQRAPSVHSMDFSEASGSVIASSMGSIDERLHG